MFDYKKYQKESAQKLGFDPTKLTEDQIDTLLIPIEAPENYYHDGEVSHAQAKKIWQDQMRKSGFTEAEIIMATKKYNL